MTNPAFRAAFTPYSSAGTSVSSFQMTVPAGVLPTDEVIIGVSEIASLADATSASPAMTTALATMVGTSSYAVVFTGTGFNANDVITISLAAAARVTCVGAVYSNASVEVVGAAGATNTTAAQAPSINTTVINDVAVALFFGIASKTLTLPAPAGWSSRGEINGGSGSRSQDCIICDKVQTGTGATNTAQSVSNVTMLGSTGIQIGLTGVTTGGGGGGGSGRKINVGGVATAATARNVNVGGVVTAAIRKTNVAGVAT